MTRSCDRKNNVSWFLEELLHYVQNTLYGEIFYLKRKIWPRNGVQQTRAIFQKTPC